MISRTRLLRNARLAAPFPRNYAGPLFRRHQGTSQLRMYTSSRLAKYRAWSKKHANILETAGVWLFFTGLGGYFAWTVSNLIGLFHPARIKTAVVACAIQKEMGRSTTLEEDNCRCLRCQDLRTCAGIRVARTMNLPDPGLPSEVHDYLQTMAMILNVAEFGYKGTMVTSDAQLDAIFVFEPKEIREWAIGIGDVEILGILERGEAELYAAQVDACEKIYKILHSDSNKETLGVTGPVGSNSTTLGQEEIIAAISEHLKAARSFTAFFKDVPIDATKLLHSNSHGLNQLEGHGVLG